MFISQDAADYLERRNAARLEEHEAKLKALNEEWRRPGNYLSFSGYFREKGHLEYKIFLAKNWLKKQAENGAEK